MIKSKGLFLVLALSIHSGSFEAQRAYGQIQAQPFEEPRTETPSIEEFLAAENLTKFFGNYTDHLDDLIQGLLKGGDVETPKRVLDHLVKLRLPMHKENPMGFPNPGGATDAAWFLGKVNSHSSNAEARLALTLEMFRNPMHGQEVEVGEYAVHNLISPLVQRFQIEIANVAGEAARLEVFKKYL